MPTILKHLTRSLRLVQLVALMGLTLSACTAQQPQDEGKAEQAPQQTSEQTRGTAVATADGKKISIDYGRPSMQGRDILSMAPVGTVWRLGMNEATEITSEADLMVGGQHLPAGKYSLWVRKTGEDDWKLAFHPQTGIWGAPELKEGYVAEIPLTLEPADDNAEQLVITAAGNGKEVKVDVHWGRSKLSGAFQTM